MCACSGIIRYLRVKVLRWLCTALVACTVREKGFAVIVVHADGTRQKFDITERGVFALRADDRRMPLRRENGCVRCPPGGLFWRAQPGAAAALYAIRGVAEVGWLLRQG